MSAIREAIHVGDVFDVTNHYITREDHPCYGTRRAVVTKVNSASFYLGGARLDWPPSRRYIIDDAGVIKTFGYGCSQEDGDLFMSLVRVD